MQPIPNITPGSKEDNRYLPISPLPLPLLSSLDPALQTIIFDAFHHAVDAGAPDAKAVVKEALTQLRHQMIGPWLPDHKTCRQAILRIISSPNEAIELAGTLLSCEESRDG